MLSKLPRTGERVCRVSGKGWTALAGGLPYHHHLKEEDEDEEEAGRMAERRGDALWLLFAGDVVARWWRWYNDQNRTG